MNPPASTNSRSGYIAGTAWRAVRVRICARRLRNRAWGLTMSASARLCKRLAKATSISWLLPAVSTSTCRPMTVAAACTSRINNSMLGLTPGLTSTAKRAALGSSSCRSSSRFAASATPKSVMPVTLPPGPVKVCDEAGLHGVAGGAEHDRDRRRCALGCECRRHAEGRGDEGDSAANEVGCQFRQAIGVVMRPPELDGQVLALDVAALAQSLAESSHSICERLRRAELEQPDYRQRRLLRARRERPCGCRAAEQRDELATPCMSGKEHCEG